MKKRITTKVMVEATNTVDLSDHHLTWKQEAFVNHYVACGNASAAYRKAYDASNASNDAIRVEAYRLRKNPHVTLAIEGFHKSKAVETLLTVDRHMAELTDLRDTVRASGQLSAAVRAEELRGKLCGSYAVKIEHARRTSSPR